jgi:hypothetical protein
MTAQKRTPSFEEALNKKKEEEEPVVGDYIDPPGMRDGVKLEVDPYVAKEAPRGKDGSVHVWHENPEHNLGKVHPDFTPQKMSSDAVGIADDKS